MSQHLFTALIEQHCYINWSSAFHSSSGFGGLGGDFLLHPFLFTCVVFPQQDSLTQTGWLVKIPSPSNLCLPLSGPPALSLLSQFHRSRLPQDKLMVFHFHSCIQQQLNYFNMKLRFVLNV